ncbi:MAG TPA: RNA polymerase sigma factor, partial [Solirubrobacteraceae bacterium]|nr:RNA polymerase sigma factor [Solirubrobacteraceae bacterium]
RSRFDERYAVVSATATARATAVLPPFQRFLDEQRDVVWRYLLARVGSAEAEDCFQETFIAAMRAYPRLRPDSNLRAWVLTIAQHKAFDAHRARTRRAQPAAEPEELAQAAGRHQDGSAPSAQDELLAREESLWQAVAELPERQRSAVTLRYLGDLPHREIAAVIGCSPEAARSSLHEALGKLRKVVEQ